MKILVTGGAGYIGSILCPELLAAGHEITVVDNFHYRQNSLAPLCLYPGFAVVNGDVRSETIMGPLIKWAEVIIPLAALVGAPICAADPVGAETINHDAVLWMFKQLRAQQIIIMPTTNSAYGSGGPDGWCDEDSPLKPVSKYARDKVLVERALMELPGAVSFRLATVFGMSPRMRLDLLVNDFTYRALKDRFVVLFESHFRRNFIHVRDVARAFLFALKNYDRLKGRVFNVGLSSANLTKAELCARIQQQVPDFVFLDAPVGSDPDKRDYLVSNERIEAAGFRPEITLEAGITELIKGYAMINNNRYGNI